MAANLRLLWNNLWSLPAGTLTGVPAEIPGLPASNTRNPDRKKIWASNPSTGTHTLDLDLGSVQAVTCVAVANIKLVGTGVLRVNQRGDAGSPGVATNVGQVSAQDGQTKVGYLFFASQSHRHWQLEFTNPTAALDSAQAGYVFLGTYTEPTVNVSVPMDTGRRDPAIVTQSVDGQESYVRRTKQYAGSWQFVDVPEADLATLRSIYDTVGMSQPIFAVLDLSLSWTAWLLRFADDLKWTFREVTGRYLVTVPWREAR